jgi:hypothetical protein
MTIRSTAGAGALALATTLLFGWGAGSALAAPAGQANASSNSSYPLSLRGNIGDYAFGSGSDSGDGQCAFCSLDNTANCECLGIENGTSTYWSWGTNPYSAIGYELEVDYLTTNLTDSGTGGSCATAIGGISVEGTFSPNELFAETTGTLCETQNGNITYTGSYVVLDDGVGLYADASGSGALSFGVGQTTIVPTVATDTPPVIYGQLQMNGNLSLTTTAPE